MNTNTDILQLVDTNRLFDYLRNNHEESQVKIDILGQLEARYRTLVADNRRLKTQYISKRKKTKSDLISVLTNDNMRLQKDVDDMRKRLDRIKMPPPPCQNPKASYMPYPVLSPPPQ